MLSLPPSSTRRGASVKAECTRRDTAGERERGEVGAEWPAFAKSRTVFGARARGRWAWRSGSGELYVRKRGRRDMGRASGKGKWRMSVEAG